MAEEKQQHQNRAEKEAYIYAVKKFYTQRVIIRTQGFRIDI